MVIGRAPAGDTGLSRRQARFLRYSSKLGHSGRQLGPQSVSAPLLAVQRWKLRQFEELHHCAIILIPQVPCDYHFFEGLHWVEFPRLAGLGISRRWQLWQYEEQRHCATTFRRLLSSIINCLQVSLLSGPLLRTPEFALLLALKVANTSASATAD